MIHRMRYIRQALPRMMTMSPAMGGSLGGSTGGDGALAVVVVVVVGPVEGGGGGGGGVDSDILPELDGGGGGAAFGLSVGTLVALAEVGPGALLAGFGLNGGRGAVAPV